ncbi:Adhesin/hemagglutinin, HecA protein [Pseudomonas syringae pv. pisi]|nr:Adhesin/hemagglutinin, HecA protein [Pseudomonas syringae pv. pisi]
MGFGGSVSGSVGYGQTNGSKNWIEEQTRITAKDKVDIRTENHTQLDGALIASDSGNLKLDTNTLGYSDIAGKDKEHGYYLNVGGSYGTGSSTTQDSSQVGKGDNQKNGWSVEGWNYNKDREQIVRGTVGAGDVMVRSDTAGKDSTAGLNRDVDKAYEITRDDEHRTDVYVTKSSLDAVASPKETLDQWQKNAALYGENSRNTIDKLVDMLVVTALLPLGAVTGNATELAQRQVARTELMQQLNSLDEDKRSAGIRTVLNRVADKNLGSNAEALVARIAELGEEHPDQAMQAMVLLTTLNKPNDGASSFVPVVALGAGAIVALSAALSTTAATPEGQDRLRAAANAVALSVAQSGQSAEQQVSTSIEIWKFLFSTTFPVHLLDGENTRLVNPIVQAQGANPSSGGYAAGATPAGVGSTGGSQIADQTPVDYSRPVVELPAPGVMNQEIVDKWSREPKSLQDEMALEAAKAGAGDVIIRNLGDEAFKGMDKIEYKVKSADGKDSVVHYVRDPKTGTLMDFKFKKHSID